MGLSNTAAMFYGGYFSEMREKIDNFSLKGAVILFFFVKPCAYLKVFPSVTERCQRFENAWFWQ